MILVDSWIVHNALPLITLTVLAFLYSYIKKKAQNLATKEDTGRITLEIERIKASFAADHTLRFAALDRRLQAHQDAFHHWSQVLAASGRANSEQPRANAEAWFDQNCLYLEPGIPDAFLEMLEGAERHDRLIKDRAKDNTIEEARTALMEFPRLLIEAAELPSFRKIESWVKHRAH